MRAWQCWRFVGASRFCRSLFPTAPRRDVISVNADSLISHDSRPSFSLSIFLDRWVSSFSPSLLPRRLLQDFFLFSVFDNCTRWPPRHLARCPICARPSPDPAPHPRPAHFPCASPALHSRRAARMTALQNLPQSWRRALFLLPVLVITLVLATGLYNGSIPKPPL